MNLQYKITDSSGSLFSSVRENRKNGFYFYRSSNIKPIGIEGFESLNQAVDCLVRIDTNKSSDEKIFAILDGDKNKGIISILRLGMFKMSLRKLSYLYEKQDI